MRATDLRSRSARGAGTAGSLNFFARSRAAPIRAFCSPGCTILRSARFAASTAARRWITTRSAINWRATPADSLISTRFHHSICTVAVCAHGAARSGAVLVVVDSSRPPLAITGIWALLDQHARGTRWNCARRTWLEREDGWSSLQKAGPVSSVYMKCALASISQQGRAVEGRVPAGRELGLGYL